MKKINDKEYLTVKVSAKEAMYRSMKALVEGKEDCTFKAEENQTTNLQAPDLKGHGVAIWINKEKEKIEGEEVTKHENQENVGL